MVIATINTGHFDFVAVGKTHSDAQQALREGWMEHCNQYDALTDLIDIAIEDGDVNYLIIEAGQCARDNQVISV